MQDLVKVFYPIAAWRAEKEGLESKRKSVYNSLEVSHTASRVFSFCQHLILTLEDI